VLYGYDPEEVLLSSAKSVAATEKRSKAAQQNSFVFRENASTAACCGKVAFVSGSTDIEVSGFGSEEGIASDSTMIPRTSLRTTEVVFFGRVFPKCFCSNLGYERSVHFI
jgi:hypothetical protein